MKKYTRFICTLALILFAAVAICTPSQAKKAPRRHKAPKAKVVKIVKVSASKTGKIKATFNTNVAWDEAATLKITDESGAVIAISSQKLNKKSVTMTAEAIKAGGVYTLDITGIKAASAKDAEFGSISRKFGVKSFKTRIKARKYTAHKKVLVIRFKHAVEFKDPTVTIVDEDGNTVEASVKATTKKTIRIATAGLKKKVRYTVTITGVKRKNDTDFGTVTYVFYRKK